MQKAIQIIEDQEKYLEGQKSMIRNTQAALDAVNRGIYEFEETENIDVVLGSEVGGLVDAFRSGVLDMIEHFEADIDRALLK